MRSGKYIRNKTKKGGGVGERNQAVADDRPDSWKTQKDLCVCGGLNINFTNHWSTWSGRQIRKGVWFIRCFQLGISSECKRGRLMRGNFIARLCKSSSLAAQCPLCCIYTIAYINIYDRNMALLFISYCVCFSPRIFIFPLNQEQSTRIPAELDPIIYDVCLW
jgi:hypothetical protein